MIRPCRFAKVVGVLLLLVACSSQDSKPTNPTTPTNPNDPAPPPEDQEYKERYSSQFGELKTFKLRDVTFRYEVIDGLAIYQGDIVLGRAAELERLSAAGLSAQGVIRTDASNCPGWLDWLCPNSDPRWQGGVIPYMIDNTFNAAERAQVEALMQQAAVHYAASTSLSLIPRTNESDYVKVTKPDDPNICGSSKLGREGGAQDLRLYPTAALGCLVHELGHAFGLAHEQSREDRDAFVQINYANVLAGDVYRSQFDKQPVHLFEDRGSYDFDSVMHYVAGAFAKAPGCNNTNRTPCTLVPRDPSINTNRLGQRNGLSVGDRLTLCNEYGANAKTFIDAPRSGSSYAVGDPIVLRGAYYFNGSQITMPMRWSSNLDGGLGDVTYPDDPLIVENLSPGTHTITLEALEKCPGVKASVTITVTGARSLEITSPQDGASFARGSQPVFFNARTKGFVTPPIISWESNRDGVIGQSTAALNRADLSYGTHIITATVNVAGAPPLQDSASITITNTAPKLRIIEPIDLTACVGDTIDFRASVFDPSDGTGQLIPWNEVVWTFAGNPIGTGRTFSRTLPAGSGTLEVAASDAQGARGSDTAPFSVSACTDDSPVVEITDPTSNLESVVVGDFDDAKDMWYKDIALAGKAVDTEDGALSGAALTWKTDQTTLQDAVLGTGETITARLYIDSCESVTHRITLTATDSSGNSSVAWREIGLYIIC